jgi:hypothetical protein
MTGLRIAVLLLGITIGIGFTAISRHVAADTPAYVPAHRHFKESVSGEKVYVGPNFCDNTATESGFSNFHYNVHKAQPGINDIQLELCQQP